MSKEPKYLPKVALARLKTATDIDTVRQKLKGQGFTAKQMKAMVRCMNYFDGLLIYVSKWNWDNHAAWHLYNWSVGDDETVKKALYEAEQFNEFGSGAYKDNFQKFDEDWKAEAYDPGATFIFQDAQVEVMEVVQEEVDNIDKKEVKKAVRQAQEAKHDKQRRRRRKQNRGSRYCKKYF